MTHRDERTGDVDRGAPSAGRRLVAVTLVLMSSAGLIGFEAWPLTAWRLFSLSRGDQQTMWVLHASTPEDDDRPVSLEELPLRYRHAAWPMSELPVADEDGREDVCQALLEPTLEVLPELIELRIVRDRQRLVERGGDWVVTHDPEVVHGCRPERAP